MEFLERIIPDCKKVLVPLDEDDYHQILVNTSKEVFKKTSNMMNIEPQISEPLIEPSTESPVIQMEPLGGEESTQENVNNNENNNNPFAKMNVEGLVKESKQQSGGQEDRKITLKFEGDNFWPVLGNSQPSCNLVTQNAGSVNPGLYYKVGGSGLNGTFADKFNEYCDGYVENINSYLDGKLEGSSTDLVYKSILVPFSEIKCNKVKNQEVIGDKVLGIMYSVGPNMSAENEYSNKNKETIINVYKEAIKSIDDYNKEEDDKINCFRITKLSSSIYAPSAIKVPNFQDELSKTILVGLFLIDEFPKDLNTILIQNNTKNSFIKVLKEMKLLDEGRKISGGANDEYKIDLDNLQKVAKDYVSKLKSIVKPIIQIEKVQVPRGKKDTSKYCDTVMREPITEKWNKYDPDWLKECEFIVDNTFKVGDFGGGGDCQFLSVAAGLNLSSDEYAITCRDVRQAIVSAISILDNESLNNLFKKYKTLEQDPLKKENFEWIENIKDIKTFKNALTQRINTLGWTYQGDDITLSLMSELYDIGFIIFDTSNKYILYIGSDNSEFIFLNYLGGSHYQLVVQFLSENKIKSLFDKDDITKIEICRQDIINKGVKNRERNKQEKELGTLEKIFKTIKPLKLSAKKPFEGALKEQLEKTGKKSLEIPEGIDEEVKRSLIEQDSNPDKAVLYFDKVPLPEPNVEVVLASSQAIEDIKNVTLKVLVRKYADLLNSFVKHMKITSEDDEYGDIFILSDCFNKLVNGNYDKEKCSFTDTESRLIFTRGILDYLDRLDKLFKSGNIDQQYLNDIPKNINMIIGVMYYIVEQIYALRKDKKIVPDLFKYIVVPIIDEDLPKYIAIPTDPKYIAIPTVPRFIAIPKIPKFVAIPVEPKFIAIPN